MEVLQRVRVRRDTWRVADVREFESCRLVTLENAATVRRVIAPFDEIAPIAPRTRPTFVRMRPWRRACRALLASHAPPGALRAAVNARIELLPHQLEPALALLRGSASRVLLADDVGLGKTIQAGLVIAELIARGWIERVLIVTPAGVRDQWAGELRDRFSIDATLADARTLRRTAAALPVGVNPWASWPIAIASLDYVKRADILPALQDIPWDVVVLDEAHVAAGESDRRDAMRSLAARAAYVLLLTATPHNGDASAFSALCGLGTIGPHDRDPLLIFRRTRHRIRGHGTRRIHTLRVRPGAIERRMHDALARYQRAVRAEHGDRSLALNVLEKRAFSSAWSLAQSIDRRLAVLAAGGPPADGSGHQLALPLEDPDGELMADDAPPPWPADLALGDAREERRLLAAVSAAARAAAGRSESKLRALGRLLRRTRESALVFTEYRDTALHVQRTIDRPSAVLHGGMARGERSRVVDDFTQRTGAVVIATDAAGQGLNLHPTCRLVVNIELPWNPMRLEQRIGRVDRIGQRRRVHAVHLVAAGTGEDGILSRLQQRVRSARASVNAPDPIGVAGSAGQDPPPFQGTDQLLADEATTEAARVAAARRFSAGSDGPRLGELEVSRPWVVRARRRRLRAALAGRALLIYRIGCEDANGRLVDWDLLPVSADPAAVDLSGTPRFPTSMVHDWRRRVACVVDPFWTRRLARERAIVASVASSHDSLFQPALFDRRAERLHAMSAVERDDRIRDRRARLADLERRSTIGGPVVELLLAVLP